MAKVLRTAAAAALIAAFLLYLPACGDIPAAPSGIPEETVPVIEGEPFTIDTFTDNSNPDIAQMQRELDYLQELLKQKGWNISLKVKGAGMDDTGDFRYAEVLRQEAAGGTAADGYYIGYNGTEKAKALVEDGLVQNVSQAVREAAPVLYDRYRAYFEQDGSGVPAAGRTCVWGKPQVLYVRKEIGEELAGRPMTISNLISMLEADPNRKIGFAGDPVFTALGIWAGEQQYYSLRYGGMGISGLFASMTDPQCVPLPIERIPGFEEFLTPVLRYTYEKRLIPLWNEEDYAAELCGYIGTLDVDMDQSFLRKINATGRDFVAIALQGCGTPRLPADEPYIISAVAVPVQSARAAELAQFVQWALTARDGYDLVRYGAKEMDYNMDGERVHFLLNGKEITQQDGDIQVYSAFFYRPPLWFYSEDMERVTMYSADNYSPFTDIQPVGYPIFAAEALCVPDIALFSDLDTKFESIIINRYESLNGYIHSEDSGTPSKVKGDADQYMAALNALWDDTDKLTAAYSERIKQILHVKGEQAINEAFAVGLQRLADSFGRRKLYNE